MNDARLEVNASVARLTGSGSVHAPIRLRLDDMSFPTDMWSDFAVLLLIEWASASLSVLLGREKAVEIRFLEGPYHVGLALGDSGQCRLTLTEDRARPVVLAECVALVRPLAQSVLQASEDILAVSYENGWYDRYSGQLASLVVRLKDALLQP
jgi:hypothetical protein